jgi:putative phosphoesterase
MRIAILSDIHGNLTAFDAVLADIQKTSPDLVLHGGDLADQGSGPLEVVDSIRSLCWQGVMGNTDEMLVRPDSLEEFASQSKAPAGLWTAIRDMAASARARLGNERLEWLRGLPLTQVREAFGLVHASPGNCWLAPEDEASETELEEVYGSLDRPMVVFGHTHRHFIRQLSSRWGVNQLGQCGTPV